MLAPDAHGAAGERQTIAHTAERGQPVWSAEWAVFVRDPPYKPNGRRAGLSTATALTASFASEAGPMAAP